MLTPECRIRLLDKIAALVDETSAGRSEMCQQFAELLHRGLTHMRNSLHVESWERRSITIRKVTRCFGGLTLGCVSANR